MAAVRLLHAGHDYDRGHMVNRKGNDLDDHTIRHELEGNLCRCTGYHNIVKAIAAGAIIVSVGCLSPVDGNALPPNT